MSTFASSSSSQAHSSSSSPKKTGAFNITPVIMVCAVCDVKYFEAYSTGGGRDNAFRLNQLFLDSLSVEAPEDDDLVSSLKFCPACSLKLSELDSLLSTMDNLQMRIQGVKDYLCATVTNTAFQCKYGVDHSSSHRVDNSSTSFLNTVRDQVMQNWVTLSRNENQSDVSIKVDVQIEESGRGSGCQFELLSSPLPNPNEPSQSQTKIKPKHQQKQQLVTSMYEDPIEILPSPTVTSLRNKRRYGRKSPISSKVQEQNALEIFDTLEEQEDIDQETSDPVEPRTANGGSGYSNGKSNTSSPENISYVSILGDTEEEESPSSQTIKLEPADMDSWGVIESVQSFSNSTATSPDGLLNHDEESTGDRDTENTAEETKASLEQEQENPSGETGEMSTLFYDESDSASDFIYNTTTIELQDPDPEQEDEGIVEEDEPPVAKRGRRQQNISSTNSSSTDLPYFHTASSATPEVRSTVVTTSPVQQQQPHAFSHRPSILRPAGSRAAKAESKEKSLDIQMCPLCYKYVVTGVKHNCEEKSTTTMYQCGYCNAVFHSERVLQEHVRRHIKAIEFPVAGSKSTVQCRLCKKQYPSPSKLALHMKEQHGADVIRCQLCPKAFKDISSFRIHMIAHTSTKSPESNKNRFMRNTEEKNFPCQYCTKVFRLHNDLRRHVLIHTGERPFQCNMCDKSFNRKHHLTTHLEVHRKSLSVLPYSEQQQKEEV